MERRGRGRPSTWNREWDAEAINMLRDGRRVADIAARFGKPRETVRNNLMVYINEMRSSGEYRPRAISLSRDDLYFTDAKIRTVWSRHADPNYYRELHYSIRAVPLPQLFGAEDD